MEKYRSELKLIEKKLLEIELLKGLIIYISDDTKPRFESVVKSSHFLYLAYQNAQRLLILDICKLIERKENANFQVFIDSVITNYSTISWHNTISTNQLNGIKEQLNAIISSGTYKQIRVQRDKFIAHDDRKKHDFKPTISFEHVWKLIQELQGLYNQVSFPLFNYTVYFKFTSQPFEIEQLYRYNLIYNRVMERVRKREELGALEEILQIIIGPT